MSERIYRDPVHNIIRLRTDTGEGELMMRLIDAPEFQRLRRIQTTGPWPLNLSGRGVFTLDTFIRRAVSVAIELTLPPAVSTRLITFFRYNGFI